MRVYAILPRMNQRTNFLLFISGALLACLAFTASADERPLPVWDMQRVWPQHRRLRLMLMEAIRRGNIADMERIARDGVSLIPGDATWRYNLACALAYRADPTAALNELETAVNFGFRDADAIEKDPDFQKIKDNRRFKGIVERARATATIPPGDRPAPTPFYVKYGGTATLTETNVVWDFDAGVFRGLVKLSGANAPSPLAERYAASRATSPERPLLLLPRLSLRRLSRSIIVSVRAGQRSPARSEHSRYSRTPGTAWMPIPAMRPSMIMAIRYIRLWRRPLRRTL